MSLDDEVSDSGYQIVGANCSIQIPFSTIKLSLKIQDQLQRDPNSTLFTTELDQETLENVKNYLVNKNGVEPAPIAAPIPVTTKTTSEAVKDKWDADFIDQVYASGSKNLRSLSNAALLLNIKSLYDLCCCKWAILIKGLPVEQAKKVFF